MCHPVYSLCNLGAIHVDRVLSLGHQLKWGKSLHCRLMKRVGSSSLEKPSISITFISAPYLEYENEIWSSKSRSAERNLCGSRCEWNSLTTVSGVRRTWSAMYPIVTSSGNRILSPTLSNLPPPATGNILAASERLRQNPAPPVANQNLILRWKNCRLMSLPSDRPIAHINKFWNFHTDSRSVQGLLFFDPISSQANLHRCCNSLPGRDLPACCPCQEFRAAPGSRAFRDTSPRGGRTVSASVAAPARWRSCHRQNGRTTCSEDSR